MFDLECVMSFVRALPGYLDVLARLCIELTTHALGILNAM
jgi:hypothetical protein